MCRVEKRKYIGHHALKVSADSVDHLQGSILLTTLDFATFNFLISMVYTQLFNLLCEKADDVYGGRLPVHVRCLIDEAANIGQIPNLEKLMATIRSREISAALVLQAKSEADQGTDLKNVFLLSVH